MCNGAILHRTEQFMLGRVLEMDVLIILLERNR